LLTDLTPPLVLGVTPIDDAGGGATFSTARVQFDEAVSIGSASNVQNYRLIKADGSFVAVSSAVIDSGDPTGATVILSFAAQSTAATYRVYAGGISDLESNTSTPIGRSYSQAATTMASASSPRAMTAGDFDGDALTDLVTTSVNNREVWFHKGLGNGGFAAPVLSFSLTGAKELNQARSADIDGDGKFDLIILETYFAGTFGNIPYGDAAVYFGKGDGTFEARHAPAGRPFAINTVTIADADADGDLDILVDGGQTFAVDLNPWNPNSPTPGTQAAVRGLESWASVESPLFTTGAIGNIRVGDVSGDGRPDVITSYGTQGLKIWLGTATPGVFSAPLSTATFNASDPSVLADINNDGHLDFLSGPGGTVALGTSSSPYFGTPQSTAFGADDSRDAFVAADLDGDGDLDLIAGRLPPRDGFRNVFDSNLYFFYNQGGGVFASTASTINLAGIGINSVIGLETADLNGDGLADLVGRDAVLRGFFVLTSQLGTPSATFTFAPNHAPAPSAGGSYTIAEGGSLTLDASASTDPDSDSLSYTWDLNGDGEFGDAVGVNPTLTWAQLNALGIVDDGSRSIAVRATDPRGLSATSSALVTIDNAAPTVALSGAATASEGSVYTLTLGASDPGADTISSWTINWGDGTAPEVVSGNPSSRTHSFADNGEYTITATATDEDGTYGANPVSVSVANVAPTLSTGGNGSSNEGSLFTRGGSFNDPGAGDTWVATVTYGDGSGIQSVVLNADKTFSLSHAYVDDGSYTVTMTLTDDDGGIATATFDVAVANVVPTVALDGPSSGAVNGQVTFSSSPANGNPFDTYTRLWTLSRTGVVGPIQTSTSMNFGFSAAQGSYTVTLVLTDDDGSSVTSTASYVVASGTSDAQADLIGYANGVWTVGVSTSSAFSTSTWATWSPNAGPIATGDFNGDGLLDVLRLEGSTLRVGLANGSSFGNAVWADLGPGTYSYLTVGDVNGDGRSDVLTRLDGYWYVSLSTGTGFAAKAAWGAWSTQVTWLDIRLTDLNGDGRADLLGRATPNWYAALSTGSAFGPAPVWTQWSNVVWDMTAVIDANGDGKSDLLGRSGSYWYVAISNGTSLGTTTLWAAWSPAANWADYRVGDFNGDGKTDIIARTSSGTWWVGLSTGSYFSDSIWGSWSNQVTWQDVRIGDFSGDGKADVAGRAGSSGTWWVGTSSGTAFNTGPYWATGWTAAYSFVAAGNVYGSSAAGAPLALQSSPIVAAASALSTSPTAALEQSLALFWSSTKNDDRFAAALLSSSRA
jgi:hypothetical protein